jgi:hypothetical protein
MGQNLPASSLTPPSPALVDRALAHLREQKLCLPLRLRGNALRTTGDRWEIVGGLTADERSTMTRSMAALNAALAPSDEASRTAALGPLWVAFPMAQMSAVMAEARLAVFSEALADLPAWAIREAVAAYVKGSVDRDNHTFAPTPAEIRIEARRRLKAFEEHRYEIHKALEAEATTPLTEAEVERRRGLVARLLAVRPRPMGEAAE